MSTRIYESRVIFAPVDKVWEMLRSANMSWLDSVASVDVTGGDAEVGSLRKVSYKDGTVQTLKVVELSDLRYTITLDMIESEPAVSVMSKVQTLTLKRVTHDNTTFIEWFSDFSNDATQEVLQDCKFKKQEGFDSLIKSISK